MARLLGTKNGQPFQELTVDDALDWLSAKLAKNSLGVNKGDREYNNLRAAVTAIQDDNYKATPHHFEGADVLHFSRNIKGAGGGMTLFWVVKDSGDVAKIVAIGQHVNDENYRLLWKADRFFNYTDMLSVTSLNRDELNTSLAERRKRRDAARKAGNPEWKFA